MTTTDTENSAVPTGDPATGVTEKFKVDSSRAAIRALRGLEQTAIMLEKWAPEIFPEVNEQGQVHFGRAMMESAAQEIRQSWASAIAETVNAKLASQVEREEEMKSALQWIADQVDNEDADLDDIILRANRALGKATPEVSDHQSDAEATEVGVVHK